jgi:hypothetical protein
MIYLKKINEEIIYPYQLGSLQKEYPQTSFPREKSLLLLSEYGVFPVQETEQPGYDPNTHKLMENSPLLVNYEWIQQWEIIELTAEELFDRIPKTVTALQGMRAIKAAGLIEGFITWKNSLDPIEDFETLAFLEKAQTWVYDDPILNNALISLNLIEQKDNLFKLANTL